MSKAGSGCTLLVGALLGAGSASASSPWRHQGSPGALDDATLSKLSQFRDQRRREEDHTAEATGLPAAHAPAGKILTVAGSKLTAVSASGTGERLASASKREALSARLKDLRAAVGALEGKATRQPPPEMLGASYVTANDITKASDHGARRNLQTCPDGSGVTVTSPEFPLLEGCLEESEDSRFANDHVEFSSDTGAIISGAVETSNSTTMDAWLAVSGDIATADFALACHSVELPSTVHPSEATWICALADGSTEVVTAATFSVDCGCDDVDGGLVSPTSTTPTSSGDSATSTSATSPTGGGCAADESLGVTSTAYPLIEGCFVETVLESGGELEYMSSTGAVILAFASEDTPLLEYWYAIYGSATDVNGIVVACVSEELAGAVHPSEATWICVDSADNFFLPTGTDFIVDCGCNGVVSPTPTTTTSPAATTPPVERGLDFTPSPVDSASTSSSPGAVDSPGAVGDPDTCAAASVTVISSEFPLLEGCLIEADIFEGGEVEYVGGEAGLIYADSSESDTDVYWYAVYFIETAMNETEPIFVCSSSEPASVEHPADATWFCDFGTEVVPATPATFGVECGCDGVVDDVGTGGGGGTMSPTPTPTTSSAGTPAPIVTDRDFGDVSDVTPAPADAEGDDDTGDGSDVTPAPADAEGDDDTPATEIPIEDDTDDAEDASPDIIGSTGGGVRRSLSAWSAAAGAGATGVVASVMTLAMGRL